MKISELLASSPSLSAAGQLSAARITALHSALSSNPALLEAPWRLVRERTTDLSVSAALVAHPLSESQIQEVLDQETHPDVLAVLVAENYTTLAQQEALRSSPAWCATIASALLDRDKVDPALAPVVAWDAFPNSTTSWLLDSGQDFLSDGELASALVEHSGHRNVIRVLELIESRPGLVNHLGSDIGRDSLLSALCASRLVERYGSDRLLTVLLEPGDYASPTKDLVELVNNPFVRLDTVARVRVVASTEAASAELVPLADKRLATDFHVASLEEATRDQLGSLLERATTDSTFRPWELTAILGHPLLDTGMLHAAMLRLVTSGLLPGADTPLGRALDYALMCSDLVPMAAFVARYANHPVRRGGDFIDFPHYEVKDTFSPSLTTAVLSRNSALGESSRRWLLAELAEASAEAWDNLWALLDDFEGTLEELVSVTKSL